MAYRGRGRAVRGAYRRCPGGLGKGGERPRTGGSCRGFERGQASSAGMQIVCLKCGRNLVALLQEAGLYENSGFLSLSFYSIDRGVREEGELARGAFPECVGCCFFRASVPTEECVPGWHRAGRMAWARGRIAKPTGLPHGARGVGFLSVEGAKAVRCFAAGAGWLRARLVSGSGRTGGEQVPPDLFSGGILPGRGKKKPYISLIHKVFLLCAPFQEFSGGRWGSNPRPSEPQSDALTN